MMCDAHAGPAFAIHLEGTIAPLRCPAGSSLLQGLERTGCRGIPTGCRGGGCGVCRIQVLQGDYTAGRMSRAHIAMEDKAEHVVLACRIKPRSDLRIRVLGRRRRAGSFTSTHGGWQQAPATDGG